MSEGCVYALMDPRTDKMRYIGATINPDQRLYGHISKPTNSAMAAWIDELGEQGLRPEMKVLRWADVEELQKEEQEVLDELFDSHELLNNHPHAFYSHRREGESRKYTVTVPDEMGEWLDDQPHLGPSGLLQRAIERQQERESVENDES